MVYSVFGLVMSMSTSVSRMFCRDELLTDELISGPIKSFPEGRYLAMLE